MRSDAKVALAVMPFFSVTRASLGASLLKASLERDGHCCDVHYLNIALAEQIEFLEYGWIGEMSPPAALLGDWLFSPWAHGLVPGTGPGPEQAETDATYISEVLLGRFGDRFTLGDALRLLRLREGLGDYLERCLAAHDWGAYRIVGFTTTFNQNCASIALARMIKVHHPEVLIVFGGANCEGDMGPGLLAAYDCIDAVCCGEGEEAFRAFVRGVLEEDAVRSAGGLLVRGGPVAPAGVPAVAMDGLPYPDFGEFYARLAASQFNGAFRPLVPFETSRGCWWGEKHHCTFCGLNGLSMRFRSKSQDRAFAELQHLAACWGTDILCVDNILDLDYLQEFLPRLARSRLGLSLHYEVKVNLSKAQLRVLADAGVSAIQPGIESFIDPVLRLMDKGSSRLQNVQLMRWCREAGVQVAWNVLYGFPGEDAADYAGMVALLPFLAHLDPPQHCGRVRADRHSPYFTYPERYGIRLAVEPAYRFVYPIDTAAVKRIAYYFDMDFSAKRCISEYEELLHRAVEAWRRRAGEGAAFMLQREGTGFVVCDSRLDLPPKCDPATAQEAAVLIACDGTTGLGRVEMLPIWESCPDAPATRAVVERLVARGWLLREGNRLLTLPLLHPDCIGAPADSVGCATTPALTPDVTVAH